MRIATTLMLGAALLAGASAASLAQNTGIQDSGSKPLPAVPAVGPARAASGDAVRALPVSADLVPARPAVKKPAVAAPAKPSDAAATRTAAADPAAQPPPTDPQGPDAGGDQSAAQEAKNNDASTIDATADKVDSDSIVATVNDESISDYELRQRVGLYLALNGITQKLTNEQRTRVRNQILEVLESEKLQLQEAVKKKITVSPVEVDKRLNAMMQEYHFTIDQLRQNLTNAGASEDALRSQITASIAWQKAVQDEYGDDVNITPAMVSAELQRYAEGANKPHYHVLEIFLPVENPDQNDKVKKDADEVERQLHQGAPFPMVARQFSQHPTAATGGDMGWVNTGQMAPELEAELSKMDAGAVSDPIRSTGGWYVLGLRERQEPLGTKIASVPTGPTGPAGTLPLARLLFPTGPRPPKDQLDQIMTVASQIQQHYSGCGQLDELHNKMTGTVYMNLGNATLSDLSPQIQEAMKNTRPGEAAMPFLSEAGVELIGRCDKRIEVKTAYVMPTRQQVEDQLFQNQISTLARRYLRDLKREANIQVRDNSKPDALIR
jgi:peptidyl-prolyl cis-trans isomerase SurA